MTSFVSQSTFETQTKIRIIIADDHAVVRFGIRSMLAREAEISILAEAEDGDAAVNQSVTFQPDIILLELTMPRCSGLEVIQSIARSSPRVKMVLLGGAITASQSLEALRLGVRGIVGKTTMVDELTLAVRAVQAGDYWFDGERFTNLVHAQAVLVKKCEVPIMRTYGLTQRELSAIQCISEGCSNRDIAKQLSISEETVKRHLSSIFDKTGVSTRLELVLFAIKRSLVVVEAA